MRSWEPMSPPDFSTEYDLGSRRALYPRGRGFELVVTPRYERHYLEQSYEALSADLLVNLLTRRELFVDVGAHCGFFSLLAATAHPHLSVVALEPVAESHRLLAEGIARNGVEARVEAVRAAASDRAGTAPFYIAEASDNCSFYPHVAAAPLRTVEVPTLPLDALLAGRRGAGRAVVKIDTDGHELAVLSGLGETLQAAEDLRLLVELNPAMQRQAGHTPEELVAELREVAADCLRVGDVMRAEGEETAADRMAHQADIATFEAYLIAAAMHAGDHQLATVDLRWDLAGDLDPDAFGAGSGRDDVFATLRRELISLVGSAEMETLWRAFDSADGA